MKGRAIPYSAEELAWLEANRTLVIGDYHRLFCECFGRSDVTAHLLHALRKRKGWKTGRTGRIEKGEAPWNKGVPFNPPGSERTRFKPGNRSGKAAQNYQPIGSERMSKDGYLERKVHDGLPLQSRWRAVHLIEWETVNGPVPEGHCLKALDGDRTNTAPGNWQAIPRALVPALNGGRRKRRPAYDAAAPELRQTLMVMAQLEHRRNEATRGMERRG